MGVEDGAEVEDNERCVEIETRGGRPVEHPTQVPCAELVERERHRSNCVREVGGRHCERVGHLRGRVDQDVNDVRQRLLSLGSSLEDVQGFLSGAFLLGAEGAFKGGGCNGVEKIQLAFGAAARGEGVEPDGAAG